MYISKYLRLKHKIICIKYYAKIQIFSNSANNYLHLVGSIDTVYMSRPFGTQASYTDNHRTAQYTMLLPFGRDTVNCLYGVMKGRTS